MKNLVLFTFLFVVFIGCKKEENLPAPYVPVNEDSEGYNLLLIGNSFFRPYAEKLDELKIFPSLTDDYVNISIDNYFGPITTEIYSLGGECLDVQYTDRLSFNSFNSGVYVCLIFYENKFKTVKVVRI